jgi:hypothetical protein
MLEYLSSFILFCTILFLYLHIQFHLKTSNDLELYEVNVCSKEKMDEMCDIRQPIIINNFDEGSSIIHSTNLNHLISHYPNFEIMVRDVSKEDGEDGENDNSQMRLPLKLEAAESVFKEGGDFITECNKDFLIETSVIKQMQRHDRFMRPSMVMSCLYDVLAGGDNSVTPLRYNTNYRNFFLVTQGNIELKLFPPKCSKYLHPIKDYVNFEYRSPINPWAPQDKYINDYGKIKCLEVKVSQGQMLYIPAYWWYSIQFSNNASISTFQYTTYMNAIATLPELVMYALQNQNITHKIMENSGEIVSSI